MPILRDTKGPNDIADNFFTSGRHNRKIGQTVMKGRLKGFPIYQLSLEERATCPRDCTHWLDCYGNTMGWGRRVKHGPELEAALPGEVQAFSEQHPAGFLLRLHGLGDFYSVFEDPI